MKIGFDNEKYLKLQSEEISNRLNSFGNKLYLEIGGKLFDDNHASRVLPGFAPDSKVRMLLNLKDTAEILIAINANDIEKNKKRSDIGITYDQDVIRLIDAFRGLGMVVNSVVITQYDGQPAADIFRRQMEKLGVKTYLHYVIQGYPNDVEHVVSEAGYGKNDYVETTRPLIFVTAPGPGSGKMEICLSQLYHDNKRGICSGYAKFETFPIWNLELEHPVNIAYESATADLGDKNEIDPYHLRAYGQTAINYNRDVENFPVLHRILTQIYGTSPYKSPTDMGVNTVGFCICNDENVRLAARQEILRRYYMALCDVRQGKPNAEETLEKQKELIARLTISTKERPVVKAALDAAEKALVLTTEEHAAAAIQLEDGKIVTGTGKTLKLLGASSAALLNALKYLADIPKDVVLIPTEIAEPVTRLKTEYLGNHNPRLHMDETLIALTIAAVSNPEARKALEVLGKLKNCEAHSTVILSATDINVYKKLGINVTCEPVYQTKKLYHSK